MPIATRYPPANVHFEMHDIAEKFRYESSSIDFVHARSISMAVRPVLVVLFDGMWRTSRRPLHANVRHGVGASQICDYGGLLPEVARVLRPGGLFVSNEWARSPIMRDGSDVNIRAPSTAEFFRAVRDTLRERRGIPTVAHKIPDLLQDSGCFTDIVSQPFFMPIGGWHDNPALRELGREYREMVELYARSMRAVLIEGPWAARAEALIQGYIDESRRVSGLVSVYYTVHARRL